VAAARLPLNLRASADGPPLSYRAFLPPAGWHRQPLVVVHGAGRRATRQFRAFLPAAIARGIPLIAPNFPPERFAGYQSLAGLDGPLSALTAFAATLDDADWHLRMATDHVDLLGFSGGAQFVHRFAMLSPTRVRRAVVVSAGWYTYLDADRPFPQGTALSPRGGGRPIDIDAFLQIPLHVLVGERDVERDANLRMSDTIDRRQGPDRLTRALRWLDHLEEAADTRALPPRVSFDLLPDTGHSFTEAVTRGGLVTRVFDFLHPADEQAAPPTGGCPVDPPLGPST
jgi:pimeloyl-ACP methyl ester carboxylesterase